MKSTSRWVLVHSPLVGPFTWSLVAHQLQARGFEVVVPTLVASEATDTPYWKRYADIVARALEQVQGGHSLILVGHSGGGPLLPAIRQAISHPVIAYGFVDANIPRHGASYLDLLTAGLPEQSEQFRDLLASGGHYPTWSDEELREVIPDGRLRQQMLAELHPKGIDFFEEPIPVFNGWPDAPCYYIRLSPAYLVSATQARKAGWLVREMEAGHFHLLIEPEVVTDTLLELVQISHPSNVKP